MTEFVRGEVTIYFEDCDITMAQRLDSGGVDLVVTSPPYMVEKPYEKGMEWPEYIDLLWRLYLGLRRILKPGGYACINFGDQARGKVIMGTETHTTIPMGVTHYDIGTYIGLELQATRIWRKKFARMGIPFVCNHYPRPVYDYEHIWTWRMPDGTGKEVVRDRKLSQRGVLEFDEKDHPLRRFPAAFPVGLPSWCIQVYSDPGALVYDPYTGSGTTGLAAVRLGRRFIGSEINDEYLEAIQQVIPISEIGA
jgi:DNA modification methylase